MVMGLVGILGLVIVAAALFIVSVVGSGSQKNKLRDAVNSNDYPTLMSMTYDSLGKPIKTDVFEGYRDDIKKAVFNELNGNGGANTSVEVDYSGALVRKPRIIVHQFTMDITDIAPDLIILVNEKEVKHGTENTIQVAAKPGENTVRFIMNMDVYNDAGSTAVVNYVDGVTQAEVNSGYGFRNYIFKASQPSMLMINGKAARELQPGENTVILPSSLNLTVSAQDPVNDKIKSKEYQLTPDNLNYDLKLEKN